MTSRTQQIEQLTQSWNDARWEGITRPYTAEEVVRLRGSVNPACTLAQLGAEKLWHLLNGYMTRMFDARLEEEILEAAKLVAGQ